MAPARKLCVYVSICAQSNAHDGPQLLGLSVLCVDLVHVFSASVLPNRRGGGGSPTELLDLAYFAHAHFLEMVIAVVTAMRRAVSELPFTTRHSNTSRRTWQQST